MLENIADHGDTGHGRNEETGYDVVRARRSEADDKEGKEGYPLSFLVLVKSPAYICEWILSLDVRKERLATESIY